MARTLVLAEKPSVGRDIARVLGAKAGGNGWLQNDQWVVSWAIGHLVALCDPDEINPGWKKWRMDSLPMLPDRLLTKVSPRTKQQFSVVKGLLLDPSIDDVVCATDSGREGELIFRYIYHQVGCKKPVRRLWISSMTDEAIREGFRNLKPSSEYDSLYLSARCRSEADWLVGMNATRAFTLRYGVLLSVGRVQTPTLNLLVTRDREIAQFQSRDYWEIRADFGDYSGLWFDPATSETRCYDRERAAQIKSQCAGGTGEVVESERELKRMPPPQLYDLTALQRDANQWMGLSAAKTLEVAQALYEKHKLITYPRTDSRYLPHDMIPGVKKALAALPDELSPLAKPLLEGALPTPGRVYNDKKVSDHHAIVPTGKRPPASLPGPERALFDMIARRLIAAHYPDYEYEAAKVVTRVGEDRFRSTGVTPLREGWRAVYRDRPAASDTPLPHLSVGDTRPVEAVTIKKLKTKPPEHLTDASLLQAMEGAGRSLEDEELRESMKDSGLGTPATRAAIIERLIEVQYVKRSGKSLVATDKGMRLIEVAPGEITSPETTGRWEKALAAIARVQDPAGQPDRFMAGIRRYAAFLVDAAKAAPSDVQFEPEPRRGANRAAANQREMDILCPVCREGHIVESARAFGCSRWKQGCKFTIWKDALVRQGGPEMAADMVTKLLAGQSVESGGATITFKDGRVYYARTNDKLIT